MIFRSPDLCYRVKLDVIKYRQMAGRAGRAGQGVRVHTRPDAIMMVDSRPEHDHAVSLINGSLPPVASTFTHPKLHPGMLRIVVEVVASGQVQSKGGDCAELAVSRTIRSAPHRVSGGLVVAVQIDLSPCCP